MPAEFPPYKGQGDGSEYSQETEGAQHGAAEVGVVKVRERDQGRGPLWRYLEAVRKIWTKPATAPRRMPVIPIQDV